MANAFGRCYCIVLYCIVLPWKALCQQIAFLQHVWDPFFLPSEQRRSLAVKSSGLTVSLDTNIIATLEGRVEESGVFEPVPVPPRPFFPAMIRIIVPYRCAWVFSGQWKRSRTKEPSECNSSLQTRVCEASNHSRSRKYIVNYNKLDACAWRVTWLSNLTFQYWIVLWDEA